MLKAGIDTLVLGCTHFPAMHAAFARVVGPGVAVIDSGAAVARQARRVLAQREWLAGADSIAREPRTLNDADALWCSGDPNQFGHVAAAILGMPVAVYGAPDMILPSLRA
jgi:glutamate racemase